MADMPDTGSEQEEVTRDLQDLADIDAGPDGGNPPRAEDRARPEGQRSEKAAGKEAKEEDAAAGDEEEASDEQDQDDEEEKPDDGEEEDKEEPVAAEGFSYKAIKEKYPNIFKEFPQLRSALFVAPQFQEIFPDPEAAKSAAAKAQEFDELEEAIVSRGDPGLLLKTLGDNNPKALHRMVENFGDALRQVSQEDYITLARPIIEEAIHLAAQHAQKIGGNNGRNLHLAARHFANFMFANGGEIPDVSHRERQEPSAAEKQLEVERSQFAEREMQRALKDIANVTSPEFDRFIGNKLDGLTEFERKTIVKETRTEVDRVLSNDKAFMNQMNALWKRAADSNYSDESKSRIKRAWLDRAKTIAPSVRNRLRQEALDARSPNRGGSQQKDGQKRTFPAQGGNNSGARSRVLDDPKKIDWSRTSDMDILNGR